MKTAFMVMLAIAVAVIILFVILGLVSRSGEAPGLVRGSLSKCPDKPNCVCSEYPEDVAHYVPPLRAVSGNPHDLLMLLKSIVSDMGGRVDAERDHYLAATFSSAIFGFVDDLEIRIDSAGQQIHVRSGSRVGYGDGGVNASRIEELRKRVEAKISAS